MKSMLPTSRRGFLRDASWSATASLATCLLPGSRAWGQAAPADFTTRVASGRQGVVASVHPLASQAAMEAFQRGGNAIDAAVAASLMLSVVDGHNSGLGGGCLALVRRSDGSLLAIDGRETAPAAATPQMFYRDGKPDPELSQLGPCAPGVPGLLAALEHMARELGAIDWRDALQSAAQVADEGFVMSDNYARVLRGAADQLRQFPASAAVLLDANGQPWPAGHRLQQPDLATTLHQLAEQGVQWFYQGEFAERAAQHLQQAGGVMTADDFASYQIARRSPIRTPYRDYHVVGFPPPSSGGIHNAQMLGMLSHFEVPAIFARSPAQGHHLLLEVMKRAMADRAHWLGDADFAKVPRGLLDPAYLQQRASSIDLSRATPVTSHGQPPRADSDLFGSARHTTHLTTADGQGNVVALTQTVNTSFGCKMIVPGSGVILNNELDDFSLAPGVRNAFGLLGSEANLIAPGKRPLSSMSPTIVLDADQRPVLSCGAAGGPRIITAVLQILVRTLDLGQPLDEALAAPRVHQQWSPDQSVCEQSLPESLYQELESMGHNVRRIASSAVAQGISWDGQQLMAAADPRVPSSAASY